MLGNNAETGCCGSGSNPRPCATPATIARYVFATLKDTKSLEGIYQVHKNLRPDGATNNVTDEYIANKTTDKECVGNYIKLSVAPDGKTYTVSIPANKHERTFETKK